VNSRSLGRLTRAAIAVAVIMTAAPAHATTIDFEDRTGPSLFADVNPFSPQQLLYSVGGVDVTIDGGVLLDEALDVPANQSTIYGTACFGGCSNSELLNPLTVSFSAPIQNFFLDVYNGWITPVTYRVSDNNGNSADFILPPSLQGGHQVIGFAATGSVVSIEALNAGGPFDFFIDNIHFDEPLPPNLVPEPTSMLLLGTGLAAARLARRRRRHTPAE